jgi:hypothetical protein
MAFCRLVFHLHLVPAHRQFFGGGFRSIEEREELLPVHEREAAPVLLVHLRLHRLPYLPECTSMEREKDHFIEARQGGHGLLHRHPVASASA